MKTPNVSDGDKKQPPPIHQDNQQLPMQRSHHNYKWKHASRERRNYSPPSPVRNDYGSHSSRQHHFSPPDRRPYHLPRYHHHSRSANRFRYPDPSPPDHRSNRTPPRDDYDRHREPPSRYYNLPSPERRLNRSPMQNEYRSQSAARYHHRDQTIPIHQRTNRLPEPHDYYSRSATQYWHSDLPPPERYSNHSLVRHPTRNSSDQPYDSQYYP